MNKTEAIERHAKRLRDLTNIQVRNLMEHADNKTPLLPVTKMVKVFVDSKGRC